MVLVYTFKGLRYNYYGRKYGGLQANILLEESLRVLHLDLQAEGGGGENLDLEWTFEIPNSSLSKTLPQTKPHLLILSNNASLW